MSRVTASDWSVSCSGCWLLMPALLLTNCMALYSLYSYKRAYDCIHREHAACIAAKQARLSASRMYSEKVREKDDTAEGSMTAGRAPPAHRHRATAAPLKQPVQQDAQQPRATSETTDGEERSTQPASPTPSPALPPCAAEEGEAVPSSASALRFHPHSSPFRVVHHMDALQYLAEHATLPGCVVTSLPDVSEMPLSVAAWKLWFVDAVAAVISRLPADGLAFFYQTDVRMSGCWTDKSFLLNLGGEKAGGRLVWHKIVVQSTVDSIKGAKAAYAHLLCFSPLPLTCRQPAAAASPSPPLLRPFAETGTSLYADILSSRGAMTWKRAMGLQACDFCVNFIVRHTRHRVVIDPFCGVGSALAVANARGCDAIGVDLNRRRCALARKLDVTGVDLSAGGKGVSVRGTRAGNGEDGDEELSRGVSRRRRRQLKRQEDEARQAAAATQTQQQEADST